MFRNSLEHHTTPDPFGRLGPDDAEPDTEIADIKNPANLNASVGDTGQNRRRDVAKTEQLLGKVGTLDLKQTDGPTGFWGSRTSDATKAFQKQNGLKVDGQINPGGETIRALSMLTGQQNKGNSAENTETLSIGVWPDGNAPSRKPISGRTPLGKGFNDSATDVESNSDDNLKFSRNDRDAALQHLIEGGLEPEVAKEFLDLLPKHLSTEDSENAFIDAMTWLSGRINSTPQNMNIPFLTVGGIRG